jgi:hypothetical protein
MGFTDHIVRSKIWRRHGQEVEDQQHNIYQELWLFARSSGHKMKAKRKVKGFMNLHATPTD